MSYWMPPGRVFHLPLESLKEGRFRGRLLESERPEADQVHRNLIGAARAAAPKTKGANLRRR